MPIPIISGKNKSIIALSLYSKPDAANGPSLGARSPPIVST
jgi:hypothetical protein